MKKVWKDGRVVVEMNEEEKRLVEDIVNSDSPSQKHVVQLLKVIINILTA